MVMNRSQLVSHSIGDIGPARWQNSEGKTPPASHLHPITIHRGMGGTWGVSVFRDRKPVLLIGSHTNGSRLDGEQTFIRMKETIEIQAGINRSLQVDEKFPCPH